MTDILGFTINFRKSHCKIPANFEKQKSRGKGKTVGARFKELYLGYRSELATCFVNSGSLGGIHEIISLLGFYDTITSKNIYLSYRITL